MSTVKADKWVRQRSFGFESSSGRTVRTKFVIPIVRRLVVFDVCAPFLVHETYDSRRATEVVRISCFVGFGRTAETCKLGKVSIARRIRQNILD